MSKINTGGPAFPLHGEFVDGEMREYQTVAQYTGITVRDYFAAKAMAEYIRENYENTRASNRGCDWNEREIAEFSYSQADAMLVARTMEL